MFFTPSRILWGAVTPHFTEDSFVFGSGVEAQTSPVMFLVVMRKFAITTEGAGHEGFQSSWIVRMFCP